MTKNHYEIGVIGNCSYLAYIDKKASVQWMCLPAFDSSFVFGGLLDKKKGGDFYIQPAEDNYQVNQYYLENTNVLCTEFECADGSKFKVTDFAPRFHQYDRYFKPLMLFRKVEILSGRPSIRVGCNPVYDYGATKPDVEYGSNHIRYNNLGSHARLTSNISSTYIIKEQAFVLSETLYFAFTYGLPLEAPLKDTTEDFLNKTISYWQTWIKSTSIGRFGQVQIIRSALILKLHQYEDTGGIIASGSCSLPEFNNSGRNWDYRYCWLRDTYYSLTAFNNIGHFEESEKYIHYIENVVHNQAGRIQPLYTITGENNITESVLDLEGYKNNQPVRIGNEAYCHIQNDVYGQILASLLPLYIDNRFHRAGRSRDMGIIRMLLEKIRETMFEKDAGIWEFRNMAFQHCYTLLFHWIGSKAAFKIAEHHKDTGLMKIAFGLIEQSAALIEKCYSKNKGGYTHAIDSNYMDASGLQLITMSYLPHNSEKTRMHLQALEKDLKYGKALFYRYLHEDDFGKPSSTFLVCAYWYVEALACVGRLDEAVEAFNELSQYQNHLGLLSEDVGVDGSTWGNFPQTYSHMGLMNAAHRIERKLDKPVFD